MLRPTQRRDVFQVLPGMPSLGPVGKYDAHHAGPRQRDSWTGEQAVKQKERTSMRRTVFERNGGFASVNRVVMSFYEKVLESPILSPYFEHTDMRTLIDHQTRFIATIMGGPASYTNDHLERVHARFGITAEAFDEAVSLLIEALEDHNFNDEDIQIVADEVKSRKRYIVSRS